MSDPAFDLRERESKLIERFPFIAWLEPQPVTVEGTTTLTCRLCTALGGLKAQDILAGRNGFTDVDAYVDHLRMVHMGGEG